MKIDAHWEGLDELQRDLAAAAADAGPALGEAITSATHGLHAAVVADAPRRTGRVASDVREKVTGTGEKTVGRVSVVGRAKIITRGARAHEIGPRVRRRGANRRALAFGGRFAAHVQHPGFKPNDFLERGGRDAEEAIGGALTNAAIRLEQKMTRGRNPRGR